MTALQDPRKEPGFKSRRYEDRVIAMLGAIYEQLVVLTQVLDSNALASVPRTKLRKKDEQVG